MSRSYQDLFTYRKSILPRGYYIGMTYDYKDCVLLRDINDIVKDTTFKKIIIDFHEETITFKNKEKSFLMSFEPAIGKISNETF